MTTTKERVTELAALMTRVDLDPADPAIDAMLTAHRTKFGLGPRDPATERALVWRGVRFDGRTIAVAGERLDGRLLEITDAYYDGTAEGKIAFTLLLYGYKAMLDRGDIDKLLHMSLWANKDHWHAIVRETGDEPHVVVFLHERKPPA